MLGLRNISLLLALGLPAAAQIDVVATTPDLAGLARRIGGDAVEVHSLTDGHEDLHLVRIRPSQLIKVNRADAFIQIGLSAEHAWVPALLRGAKNRSVAPGGSGFCDCARGVEALDVPETVSRGDGPDIHPQGNPHYTLDPDRMRQAARNIRDCLIRLDGDRAAAFKRRTKEWEGELDERIARWKAALEPCRNAPFIEHHRAWVYFAEAFDLRIVASLEPRPGMPPTPSHLSRVIEQAQKEDVRLIVARPQNEDVARRVASECAAEVAILRLGSTAEGAAGDWLSYMDHVVKTFATHLKKTEKE